MSQAESRGNSPRLARHRERREGKQPVLHTAPTDWRIIDYGCRNNGNIQLRWRMLHSTLAQESAAVRPLQFLRRPHVLPGAICRTGAALANVGLCIAARFLQENAELASLVEVNSYWHVICCRSASLPCAPYSCAPF